MNVLRLLIVLLAGTAACVAHAATGDRLDIDQFRLTWEERFDTLDVSAWGTPPARWIAHTPWYGDFGDARFTDPGNGFPFTTRAGVLRIEARKGSDDVWRSGLLSSVDTAGNGFAQKYGYFEARMKFPPGKGVWPSFWLIGRDRVSGASDHTAEIDVVEYYGRAPGEFRSAAHIWPRAGSTVQESHRHNRHEVANSLTANFHTYGVLIGETDTVYYFDRREIWRFPTPPQYRVPMFPLVNLALGGGWPIDETPNPSYLYVDYVRAYSEAPAATKTPARRASFFSRIAPPRR
ncbi:glycoside hydrolase family 16 protein [Coralloluteibacterium stylophorae]|uniref:Glycoside hydrolase family 16 protein n=1 Tax=Coralloluteibacterium stylophorae TaxID=1776034 RepID=A0A8J7VU73_9GAMM|nr:glycoside hydrolase family 16 protein [Coralloluteibacterium stylophorae]MBS7457539.1 glycoside hydrolase family 16 protein [Coralloluteibacterium stylophorae]